MHYKTAIITMIILLSIFTEIFSQDNNYTAEDLLAGFQRTEALYKKLEKRVFYLDENFEYSTEIHVVDDILFLLKPVPSMIYQAYTTIILYKQIENAKVNSSNKKIVRDSFTKMEIAIMEIQMRILGCSPSTGSFKNTIYLQEIDQNLTELYNTLVYLAPR